MRNSICYHSNENNKSHDSENEKDWWTQAMHINYLLNFFRFLPIFHIYLGECSAFLLVMPPNLRPDSFRPHILISTKDSRHSPLHRLLRSSTTNISRRMHLAVNGRNYVFCLYLPRALDFMFLFQSFFSFSGTRKRISKPRWKNEYLL